MNFLERLIFFWRRALGERTPRERFALIAMALTIAGALWIQLLWSAHHARTSYSASVAEAQSRIEAMRLAADALAAAKARGPVVRMVSSEKTLTAFSDGLLAAGVSGLGVLPDAQGRVRVSGTADFDRWIGWVAKMQEDFGAQVLHAAIEPAGPAGMVKIDATMALPDTR